MRDINEIAWDVHEQMVDRAAEGHIDFAPDLDPDDEIEKILENFSVNGGEVEKTIDWAKAMYDHIDEIEWGLLATVLSELDPDEIELT